MVNTEDDFHDWDDYLKRLRRWQWKWSYWLQSDFGFCPGVTCDVPRSWCTNFIQVDFCVVNAMKYMFCDFWAESQQCVSSFKPMGEYLHLNFPKDVIILDKTFDSLSSSKLYYCTQMSNSVKTYYPKNQSKMSYMVENIFMFHVFIEGTDIRNWSRLSNLVWLCPLWGAVCLKNAHVSIVL